jgi:hypothetical protein
MRDGAEQPNAKPVPKPPFGRNRRRHSLRNKKRESAAEQKERPEEKQREKVQTHMIQTTECASIVARDSADD